MVADGVPDETDDGVQFKLLHDVVTMGSRWPRAGLRRDRLAQPSSSARNDYDFSVQTHHFPPLSIVRPRPTDRSQPRFGSSGVNPCFKRDGVNVINGPSRVKRRMDLRL